MQIFHGRSLVIATKHSKEKVLAPLLEEKLGVQCVLDSQLDTDQLGTFTGEVERIQCPLDTVRQKCLMAMNNTRCDLALASEGSFYPHPFIPILHVDEELLLFIDRKNQLEIFVKEVSFETNFKGASIHSEEELVYFCQQVQFPSHALILRKSKHDYSDLVKGICHYTDLITHFNRFLQRYGMCYVETDMRALFNPTRMLVIERLNHKMVQKIKSCCPQCATPGFDVDQMVKGLPCSVCGMPTRSVLLHIYACKKCNHREEKMYPHGIRFEGPLYCDHCNP